ncbi:hypothetical protein DFJ74DRAFT_714033 [Hyaloraphidium curvatum]|nr:hypothetical protein DFJ74DRAFT_714033 [Hyaloraphidium curvatum]
MDQRSLLSRAAAVFVGFLFVFGGATSLLPPADPRDAPRGPLRVDFCAAPPSPEALRDAQAVARRFYEVGRRRANCPPFELLRGIAERIADPSPAVVNIGCNKGYNVAAWLALWAPQLGIHSGRQWFDALPGRTDRREGACKDAEQRYSPARKAAFVAADPALPNVWCIDPVASNAELVRGALAKLVGDALPAVRTVTAAFSYSPAPGTPPGSRTASFRDCKAGDELCSFETGARSVSVPLLSVDEWIALENPHRASATGRISFMEIDTEGHDPAVLFGAAGTLASGLVDVVLFEYHHVGLWERVSLQIVVGMLAGHGYACYFPAAGRTWRLDPCNWSEHWERDRWWSNVVCARGGTPFVEYLDSTAVNATNLDSVA